MNTTYPPLLTLSSFGCGRYLAERVAVFFALVHLVVRDSPARHAAYLRFVFEGIEVPLPPMA